MRSKWAGVIATAALLAVLLPQVTAADPFTLLGSLTVTKGNDTALTTELTGFALIANPGLEKAITQQLPPFTLPVFLDGDDDGHPGGPPAGARLLRRNFDTTLVLTNTTAAPLVVKLTLQGATGAVLGTPVTKTFAAHETMMLLISDLLP